MWIKLDQKQYISSGPTEILLIKFVCIKQRHFQKNYKINMPQAHKNKHPKCDK